VLTLHHPVPKWNLFTNPLSLYGRRLCRTGTAGVPARFAENTPKCRRSIEM
jgi:hypothetical protein